MTLPQRNPVARFHVAGQSTLAFVESTDDTFAGYIAKNSEAEWFTGVRWNDGEWALIQNSPSSATRLVVTTSGNFAVPSLLCTLMTLGADRIMFGAGEGRWGFLACHCHRICRGGWRLNAGAPDKCDG